MRIDATRMMTIKPELMELIKNLEVGDTLKGKVLEALGSSITIKAAGGQIFTAALQDGASISKGTFVELVINNIADGKIYAEFKSESKAADMDSKVSALLMQLNLPIEEKNIEAVKLLVKYNLPVDREEVTDITMLKKSIDNLNQSNESRISLMLSGLDLKNTPVDVLNKIVLSWPNDIANEAAEVKSADINEDNIPGKNVPNGKVQEQADNTQTAKALTKEVKTEINIETSKLLLQEEESVSTKAESKHAKEIDALQEKPVNVPIRGSSDNMEENKGAELVKVLDKLGIESGSEIKRFAGQVADILASIKNADMEALTYLASKELEPTPKNIGILIKNIENTDGISQFLDKLQKRLTVEDNAELKEIKEAIKKVFLEPRQLEDKKEVAEQLKDVVKLGEKLESYLDISGNKDPEIREALSNLRDSIDFIKNINEYNNFIQMPMMINGDTSTAKLYVFNEGKRIKTINPENATILLALDLKALGHLESMISIKGKSVNVTFRVENNSIGAMLEGSSQQLKDSLAVKGYSLVPVRIISLGEPFSLLSMEALINERRNGKIHFDKRV